MELKGLTVTDIEDVIARAICNAVKPKPAGTIDAWDNLLSWSLERGEAAWEAGQFSSQAKAVIAALEAAGMVVVPIEPYSVQMIAGDAAYRESIGGGASYGGMDGIVCAYRAMIASAPGRKP